MNNKFIVILLLLLCSFTYATCVGGYNDTFNVRVLDAKLRPVANAQVSLTFDRGVSFGSQYLTTPLRTTDASGEYQFAVFNQGTNTRTIDCTIKIYTQVGLANTTTIITANTHPPIVDIPMKVYPVLFNVQDQFGKALPNAVVTFDSDTQIANYLGAVLMYNNKGNHTYLVNYLDGKQSGIVTVYDDMTQDIVLTHHDVEVHAMDDFGNLVNANISIFNSTYPVQNGDFKYKNSFGDNIPFSVDYNGTVQRGSIIPALSTSATVVFDLHAPLFQDIKNIIQNNKPALTIQIIDPGQFASGVNAQSIQVTYKVQDAANNAAWTSATTFTSGKNTYTTQFPEIKPNTIVQFHILVKDRAGNSASVDGSFSTANDITQPPQNDTNPQIKTPNDQGIPLIYIIIGGIIAVLVIYVLFRIRPKQQ